MSKNILLSAVNFGVFNFSLQFILARLQTVSSVACIHEEFFLNGTILHSFQNGNTDIDDLSSKILIWHSKVHMLVFPCTHSMILEGGSPLSSESSINQNTKKINLANCSPTLTVISHTFSVIRFRVNLVLNIGVTRPSKFPINLRNEIHSTMDREVYAYTHRIIVFSSNCNCLCGLVLYSFTECANACIIPFEAVGFFPISTSFRTVLL